MSRESKQESTYQGGCFCGAVQIEVRGAPEGMGYCHCESCRRWSAGPVNAFSLWKTDAVKVVRGEEHLAIYNRTPKSGRQWCKQCGGHVMTAHPHWGLIDVYAAALPDLPYQPGVHVNYQESRLAMNDGLPKMKDFPAELGGSGLLMET
ncbi:MAG TPA: GFA family protein [Burkholderiales bacterium]|nr:GFA family protein [Burkholderiales bacterium]